MTSIFIIVTFIVIVVYDLVMLWKNRKKEDPKWKFITTIFRHWYKEAPYVPYMVGVVFIGHFQSEIEVYCVPFFIVFSAMYISWCILMDKTNIKNHLSIKMGLVLVRGSLPNKEKKWVPGKSILIMAS